MSYGTATREVIGEWRLAYAMATTTEGRRIARAKLQELGGDLPTDEDIASLGGLPVSEEEPPFRMGFTAADAAGRFTVTPYASAEEADAPPGQARR